MATEVATTRTTGSQFDDRRAETLAQLLANGASLAVAAASAGVSNAAAARLRKDPEFIVRLSELQKKASTYTTMSLAQVACELEETAREARGEKQYKAAIEAYKLLREMIKGDADMLSGIGQALPANRAARGAELQRRLRGENAPPIDTTADDDEAAE